MILQVCQHSIIKGYFKKKNKNLFVYLLFSQKLKFYIQLVTTTKKTYSNHVR